MERVIRCGGHVPRIDADGGLVERADTGNGPARVDPYMLRHFMILTLLHDMRAIASAGTYEKGIAMLSDCVLLVSRACVLGRCKTTSSQITSRSKSNRQRSAAAAIGAHAGSSIPPGGGGTAS